MILVILQHLMSYLETFIPKIWQQMAIEIKQDKCNETLGALSDYPPRNKKYIEAKNNLLDNAKNFY